MSLLGKNGEFVSKEAAEELERALAASHADVSVVQDTLEKLSQENPNISFDDDQNDPEITLNETLLNSDSLDSETLPDIIHQDVDKLREMVSQGALGNTTTLSALQQVFSSTSSIAQTSRLSSYSQNGFQQLPCTNAHMMGTSLSFTENIPSQMPFIPSTTSSNVRAQPNYNGMAIPAHTIANGLSWCNQPLPSFQNGFGGTTFPFSGSGGALPNIKTILQPQQLVPGITTPVTIATSPGKSDVSFSNQLFQTAFFSNGSLLAPTSQGQVVQVITNPASQQ